MGKGPFEWVDKRVFDAVFDKSTLLAIHKLMQKGDIETIDYPIARVRKPMSSTPHQSTAQ